MSRLSQQGRRKWRSRVAKERAKIRARRIMAKYFRAYRDAAFELYSARAGQGLFADFIKPLADANGFQRHAPVDSAAADKCERCGAGPPLFEHIYIDCTMRFCSRCKADAIDEDDDHDK